MLKKDRSATLGEIGSSEGLGRLNQASGQVVLLRTFSMIDPGRVAFCYVSHEQANSLFSSISRDC